MQIFEFNYTVKGLMGITIVRDRGTVTGYGEVPEAIKLYDYIRENFPFWRKIKMQVGDYKLDIARKNLPHFLAE